MTGEQHDITERTFSFALHIVRLCRKLDQTPGIGRTLAQQLLRSGTSIGANVEEARAGQSKADFISKNAIALKEARETRYWLRLITESEVIKNNDEIVYLLQEAGELSKILGAIVSRAKQKDSL
ncbi:MAG TPA: four helix bundle protein [Nitrospiraceae bacterium]|jgi:four helix bundle protein|nr:four helix bundle protein [Nitrospiraceae bacterium]